MSYTLPAAHVTAAMRAALDYADEHHLPLTGIEHRTPDHPGQHSRIHILIGPAAAPAWIDTLVTGTNPAEPEYRDGSSGVWFGTLDTTLPTTGVRIRLRWATFNPTRACTECGTETYGRTDCCDDSQLCGQCNPGRCGCCDCVGRAEAAYSDYRNHVDHTADRIGA